MSLVTRVISQPPGGGKVPQAPSLSSVAVLRGVVKQRMRPATTEPTA